MDKMVLNCLPEPSDDEFESMRLVLCAQNLIETELVITILKKAANDFFVNVVGYSENVLSIATEYLKSSDIKKTLEGVRMINKIIYQTPTNTTVFLDALLARSRYYFRIGKYPLAINDLIYYKALSPKLMTTEGLLLVQTLLCFALYLMREMHEARIQLLQLEEVLEQLNVNLFQNKELQTLLETLQKYKFEISQPSNNIQYVVKTKCLSYVPSHGFKFDKHIPFASSACDYVSQNNLVGVYARRAFAKGEVIISEDPQYIQFSTPLMNCEVCGIHQEQLYTCINCRYKTYCSLSCIESDWEDHKDECFGYSFGIIQMLEAKLLFKFFVEAAKFLSPAIINFTLEHGPMQDANAAWNFIVDYAKSNKTQYTIIGEFLYRQTDCKLFTKAKWQQLQTSAFRLAVFVYNDTEIMEQYFSHLELKKLESIRLIAAVLMRLNVHITLNSQRNDMDYQESKSSSSDNSEYQVELKTNMNANAFGFYSINAHSDFVNCYSKLQERISSIKDSGLHKSNKVEINTNQESPISEYIYKILSLCLKKVKIQSSDDLIKIETPSSLYIQNCLIKLNTSERCALLATFTKYFYECLVDYFCDFGFRRQEKLALCAIIKSFSHCCSANMEIRSLKNGSYIGITKMNIEHDTEMTVNRYSVNQLGIICKCKACIIPALINPNNLHQAIFCAYCEEEDIEITEALGKCSQCHVAYTELYQQYIKFISCIEREIRVKESASKADPRDLAILYGTYNSYVTMHFSEGHDLRLSGVLSFVEFLTSKGFLNHACDILFLLHNSDHFYNEPAHNYNKNIEFRIFTIIQKIIKSYIENLFSSNCLEVNPIYPKMLLAIALHMLRTRQQYLDASLEDSEAHNAFLENYTHYFKWKKIINANLTMSVSLQKYLNII